MRRPLDTERAAALWTVDLLRKKGNLAELMSIEADASTLEIATKGFAGKLLRLMPRGWAYQEQLTYCRLFDDQFETTLRDSSPRLVPTELSNRRIRTEKELQGEQPSAGCSIINWLRRFFCLAWGTWACESPPLRFAQTKPRLAARWKDIESRTNTFLKTERPRSKIRFGTSTGPCFRRAYRYSRKKQDTSSIPLAGMRKMMAAALDGPFSTKMLGIGSGKFIER